VGGDVRVGGNERLLRLGDETFSAFPSLANVVGALHIENNPFLERLEGFEALRSVGGVCIERNAALTSIAPRPARRSERASLSARVTGVTKKKTPTRRPAVPKVERGGRERRRGSSSRTTARC
jgi:hypothetical protein